MALTQAESRSASPVRSGAGSRALVAGAVVGAVLLMGAAVLLWVQNGPAVFFETVAAGFAACF